MGGARAIVDRARGRHASELQTKIVYSAGFLVAGPSGGACGGVRKTMAFKIDRST